MRNILNRIAVALVALSLAGCAGIPGLPSLQSIETAVQLGTASVANPVTPERMDQAENALVLVFTGLNAWKASCKNGVIPPGCRDQIAAVQVYTRKLPPLLKELRGFVRNNDQVNAFVAFNTFSSLIGTVRTQAAQSGVQIGS